MSIGGVLQREAMQLAAAQEQRVAELHKQYLQIQAQAEELRAKRDNARAASERSANFPVKIGGDYCCPTCWVERNSRGALMPKPSGNREDIFECAQCGHTVTITY
jgi:hypothetical protein